MTTGQLNSSSSAKAPPAGKRSLAFCLLGLLSLSIAALIWIPSLHLFLSPGVAEYYAADRIAPAAQRLANRQLALWADPELRAAEVERMRGSNAEWDFMGRTFLVLALANMALHEPARETECLTAIDAIIDETLRLETSEGHLYFLMDYARAGEFVDEAGRSLFVDGEIGMMLAARRLVREKAQYVEPFLEKRRLILEQMRRGPVLCAESYPNECWMFCNMAALAALRMGEALGHGEDREFPAQWLAVALDKLTHDGTGLLISSFTIEGQRMDGPEGSSIWFVLHCLDLIDEAEARRQFVVARRELYREVMGFGYAQEWPDSWVGKPDIDSGPIIPGLDASAGSSGLAILAATTFGDTEMLRGLLTSLNLAAFPEGDAEQLRFHASNQVGDAVMLYSLVHGPLWRKVKEAN